MSDILYFKMADMKDDELRNLFGLIIPQYVDKCCIACGFHNQVPLAIVATNDDELTEKIKNLLSRSSATHRGRNT